MTTEMIILRSVSAILLSCLLVYLHKRLHRGELSFTLGIIWSLAIVGALLLCLAPDVLSPVSSHLGAELPVHFLFFTVQFFLVLLVFGLTLKSARQERKIVKLAQELAHLQLEFENEVSQNEPQLQRLVANQS